MKRTDKDYEKVKSAFRIAREKECFAIVNRGQVWYDLLTDTQKAQLKAWYNAWLDVTKTFIMPEKPSWLK